MKSLLTSAAVLAIAATALMTPAISQTSGSGQASPPAASGPGAGPGPNYGPHGWGRGMMMGPGMMGMGGMGAMCDPRGAGLAEWRMERIERLVQTMHNAPRSTICGMHQPKLPRSSLQPARASFRPVLPGGLS
jgi:hypothetical protein